MKSSGESFVSRTMRRMFSLDLSLLGRYTGWNMGSPGICRGHGAERMALQSSALCSLLSATIETYPQPQPPEPQPPPDRFGVDSSPPQPQLPPPGAPFGNPRTKPSPRSSLIKPSSAPSSVLAVAASTYSLAPFFSTTVSPSPALSSIMIS